MKRLLLILVLLPALSWSANIGEFPDNQAIIGTDLVPIFQPTHSETEKTRVATVGELHAVHEAKSNPHPVYTLLSDFAAHLSGYDHTWLHQHANQTTLDKITESGGLPLWDGSAWPGSGAGGDMYKLTYDQDDDGTVDAAESVPWTGVTGAPAYQPASANLDTYAGIAPAANVQSLLSAADYAAILLLLGIEDGATADLTAAEIVALVDAYYGSTAWRTQDGTGSDDQTAEEVTYSNVTSGLLSTTVQAAVDEVAGRVATVEGWGDHAGLYDPDGSAGAAVAGHEGTYPHANLPTTDQKASFPVGASAIDQLVKDSDPRLIDARTPTAHDNAAHSETYLITETDAAALAALASHVEDVDNPHATTKSHVGLAYVENIKHAYGMGITPPVTADSSVGYEVGKSLWLMTTGAVYICTDATVGAAVWQSIGGGGTWGSITGTLADQTDLQAALDAKVATTDTTAWDKNAADDFSGAYGDLTGKPTLGTAAAKDIPATGNASATEVVYGTDTRLTDARTPEAHNNTAHSETYLTAETDPNALLTAGTDNVKDTHIDWGVGAGQVSADDLPDGATNAVPTLTQESNWDTAYGWGDHAGLYDTLGSAAAAQAASEPADPTIIKEPELASLETDPTVDGKIATHAVLPDVHYPHGTAAALNVGTTAGTVAAGAHNQAFSTITSTPTTLSGYGITDAAISAQGKRTHTYNTDTQQFFSEPIHNSCTTSTGVIFGAKGDVIQKSTDGGFSWITLKTFTNASEFRAVFCAENDYVYVSAMNSHGAPFMDSTLTGLWRTTDGTNFTREIALGEAESIWGMTEDLSGNLYAGVYTLASAADNDVIYKSIDDGATWAPSFDGSYRHIHGLAYDSASGNVYTVAGDPTSDSGILVSTNSGSSWSLILSALPKMTTVLATSTSRLFGTDASPYGRIYRTTDDSVATVVLDTHYQNCFFIRQNPATGNIYAGFKLDPSATAPLRAAIYRSTDDGVTWTAIRTFENLAAGEGAWFASNFYMDLLYVGVKVDADWQNGLIIKDVPEDTLNSITSRGASTINNVTVGGLVSNGAVTVTDTTDEQIILAYDGTNKTSLKTNSLGEFIINPSGGNLGVGTDPDSTFHVATTGATGARIVNTNAGGGGLMLAQLDGAAASSGERISLVYMTGSEDSANTAGSGGTMAAWAGSAWAKRNNETYLTWEISRPYFPAREIGIRVDSDTDVGVGLTGSPASARLHVKNSPVYTVSPSVTGLNDLGFNFSSQNALTGNNGDYYTITIDGVSTPNTFKWSKNGGTETSGVSITGGTQSLTDGVSIVFEATTGHTINDSWVLTLAHQPALLVEDRLGSDMLSVNYDGSLSVSGGVKFGTSPSCDSSTRGTFRYTAGDTGVEDSMEMCAKNSTDAYDWRDVAITY